jgi:hypothetical protein
MVAGYQAKLGTIPVEESLRLLRVEKLADEGAADADERVGDATERARDVAERGARRRYVDAPTD